MNASQLGLLINDLINTMTHDNMVACSALSAVLATRIATQRNATAADSDLIVSGTDLLRSHIKIAIKHNNKVQSAARN